MYVNISTAFHGRSREVNPWRKWPNNSQKCFRKRKNPFVKIWTNSEKKTEKNFQEFLKKFWKVSTTCNLVRSFQLILRSRFCYMTIHLWKQAILTVLSSIRSCFRAGHLCTSKIACVHALLFFAVLCYLHVISYILYLFSSYKQVGSRLPESKTKQKKNLVSNLTVIIWKPYPNKIAEKPKN